MISPDYKERLRLQFKIYTDLYNAEDPKIKLKIDHTYRVADLCEKIALSLNLSPEDVLISWTTGMLHDVGRFEQVKRYNTFVDSKSVDHAQFGADLLFKENLYETMVYSNISPDQRLLVEKAIRAHSSFRIPEDLSSREMMFANILRDADKIDIFRVNCESPIDKVYNTPMEEFLMADVSSDVRTAFIERRCAKRNERHTAIDFLVGHICMLFELVFDESLRIADKQGFIYKLLDFKSNNPETVKWFDYMKESVREYTKTKEV